jgi:hypothetical protein
LVSREWAHTGRFLAHSIPSFYERYPIPHVVKLWEAAGIADVHVRPMSLGGGVVMWGHKQARGPSGAAATVDTSSATTASEPSALAASPVGKAGPGDSTEPA